MGQTAAVEVFGANMYIKDSRSVLSMDKKP